MLLLFLPLLSCERAPERPPDVILLLVDTLRADHLSLYGYERPTSPELDRFAESATVLEHVVAPSSWTLPSVASLFTGTYPTVHDLRAFKPGGASITMRPGLSTLSEQFAASGYRTVAAVTNPWITISRNGLTRGFEHVEGMRRASADELHDYARSALEAADPRPTFLYLHYMDVHGPFNAQEGNEDLGPVPEAYRREMGPQEGERVPGYFRIADTNRLDTYIEAYDQGIRRWDRSLGLFLDWLEESGRLEHTIVCLVSDHGEEFLEHGGWNHGITLFQEQLSVPWVLYLPGKSGRRISDRPASLIDVGPTLLGLIGKEPPATMLGLDILTDSVDPARPLFSETDIRVGLLAIGTPQRVMVRGGRKVLARAREPEGPDATPRELIFFDLDSDPEEQDPIACDQLDKRCRESEFKELAAWEAEMKQWAARLEDGQSFEASPEDIEALKALGY